MKLTTTLLFIALYTSALAQSRGERISFHPTMNGESMEIGQSYYATALKDSVRFDALKFYISAIQLFQDEQLVFTLQKKHYLIDLENRESLIVDLKTKEDVDFKKGEGFDLKYNRIQFSLGVDSLTNSSGAFGGDLDPTNGMYWTWQSGYINFKLEGVSKVCPARKNVFQFHLGGFLGEENALQKISLAVSGKDNKIEFAIDEWLEQINLKEQYQIMSPSVEAVKMSKLVADLFKI